MECQLISFETYDISKEFNIFAFGRNNEGQSIGLRIVGFRPYFYLLAKNKKTVYDVELTILNIKDYIKKNIEGCDKSLIDIIIEPNKKRLFPYTPNNDEIFIKLIFKSEWIMRSCAMELKNLHYCNKNENDLNFKNFERFEDNIPALLRCLHERHIQPSGWVFFDPCESLPDDGFNNTLCDFNYVIDYRKLQSRPDINIIAPFRIASFDLECFSKRSFDADCASFFPDSNNDDDVIAQIGVSVLTYGNDTLTDKKVFTLDISGREDNEYIKSERCEIITCNDEQHLIEEWANYIKNMDIDVLTGYNIFGFDYEYLHDRSNILYKYNPDDNILLTGLSRINSKECKLKERNLTSNAFGDNTYKYIHMPGRLQFDFYAYVRREFKLESYKLDNVSEHFLKQKKDDVPPIEIFRKLKGTSEDIRTVSEYCFQDTNLVIELIKKLKVFISMIEMSKVTRVPYDFLVFRGQQIKVFSQIAYETMNENYVIPSNIHKFNKKNLNEEEEDEGYTGATVLDAKQGCYFNCISGLDFASLYPSIMIAYNMCYSTIVIDKDILVNETVENICPKDRTVTFVQNKEGLLPKILNKLWKTRKSIRKQMSETSDKDLIEILNCKQLAIKVSMNSVYGFCGAKNGILPCVDIASCVTTKGREMIDHTKRLVEELYPMAEVIYGDTDSVYVHFKSANDDMHKVFEISTEAAARISETFPKPIELEFEKVMYPFILFTKKRYASLVWTNPDKHDKVDFKGIQIVRRDCCHYMKNVFKEIFDVLLYERNINKCEELVHRRLYELVLGSVDIKELVLSKSLKSDYKNRNLPHVALMDKMKKRDPMNYPKPGERVQYVFIETFKKEQLCFKSEDPNYVLENKLDIDYEYYLEKQLKKPIEELFKILYNNQNKEFDFYQNLKGPLNQLERLRIKKRNELNKQKEICSYFKSVK